MTPCAGGMTQKAKVPGAIENKGLAVALRSFTYQTVVTAFQLVFGLDRNGLPHVELHCSIRRSNLMTLRRTKRHGLL